MKYSSKKESEYEDHKLKEIIEKRISEVFQLKYILENLPGDVYWKDANGVYLGMNTTGLESLRRMGFIRKREGVIGKTDYDLFEKETADEFRKSDLMVQETGIPITREEIAILPSGETIIQLSTKRPLRDEKSYIIGIIGNTIDITYLKKIESDLREAKEKAEVSDQIKTDFLRNMEHDIRTPFTGAWGIAHHLREQETDAEKKELLGAIVKCTKELLDFCNTILDFSRDENISSPILAKKFNVREVLERIVSLEQPAAKNKKLDFVFNYDDNIPNILIGDENRLLRIILNLTSNAIKFTPDGYIKLIAKLAKRDGKKVILKIEVEDTGIGIPEEKQNFIYEAFSRITPSNQGKYSGIGLGLRIVKRMVEEMEGEIELISNLGKGSTFTCILPFQLPLLD